MKTIPNEKFCINCWEYLNLPNTQKEIVPVIFAWYRDSQKIRKRLVFRGFEPYFFVDQNCMVPQFYYHKESGEKERLVKRLVTQVRSPDNPMLTKVITFLPSQVRLIRTLLENAHYEDHIFEADIEFIYRFMIDKKIKCALERTPSGFLPTDEDIPSNLKYVFLDLEVFTNRKPDPRKLRVGEKVICATLWDNYSKIYHLFYEYSRQLTLPSFGPDVIVHYCITERELLKSVARYIIEQDPDIIAGYNIDWDLTCLIKTMEQRYKMSPDVISPLKKVKIHNSKKRLGDILVNAPRAKIFGRSTLDLLELYLKMHLSGLEEMTLEYVAQLEKLPVQKILVPDFFETWNKNPELIIRRNLGDVQIYVELEKKLNLIRFADEQRKLVGCFLSNANVLLPDISEQKISKIKPGDMVLGKDGKTHRVIGTSTREYHGYIYNLEIRGNGNLEATEEHPILSIKRNRIPLNRWNKLDYSNPSFSGNWKNPEFNKISNLKEGDFVAMPINVGEKEVIFETTNWKKNNSKWNIPTQLKITEEFGEFIGYFLAEGSYKKDQKKRPTALVFSLHLKEKEFSSRILDLAHKLFGVKGKEYPRPNKTLREVHVNSSQLARLFFSFFGDGAWKKHLPEEFITLPKKIQECILEGFYRGDGYFDKINKIRKITSRSKLLIDQFKMIAWRNKIPAYVGKGTEYDLFLGKNKFLKGKITNNFFFREILSIKKRQEKTLVYNLEIESEPSYIVSNVAVHNCKLEDTLSSKKMLDLFMMRMKGKKIMPTARSRGAKYIGAYVRNPLPGMYSWVIQFDFVALYPNIMICFNIDPDTFRNPQFYKGSEDLFRLDESHAFVKDPIGLIPKMLKKLLELRAEKRKLQVEALARNDDEAYKMYNLQEGVVKVLSNALYGVMGYRFRKGSKETVESVTLMGRNLITFVAEKLIESGRRVIYGDSVLPDSPVIIKNSFQKIDIKPIAETKKGEFVWSDKGFTEILRVIMKKKRKKIYRVNSRKGIVDVTEDHSLLDEKAQICTPLEIDIGSKLLQKDLPISNQISFKEDLSWLYGLFSAEGTAKNYSYKAVWKIDMQNYYALRKAGEILKKYYPLEYSIFSIPSSGKGMYRLIPNGGYGEIRKIAKEWNKEFYDSFGKKKIPSTILNSSSQSKRAFLKGYNIGDGSNDKRYHFEFQDFQTNSKTLALGLVFLLENLDLDYNLQIRKDKTEITRIRVNCPRKKKGNFKRKKVSNAIKKIYEIPSSFKEVIDLETENHHFHTGVGQIIVHNTDSVFFEAKGQTLDECLAEAKKIQTLIHAKLPEFLSKFGTTGEQPFNADPAQIYSTFFILEAKKRYAGKIEWDSKRGTKLSYRYNIKGLETRRSDLSVFGKRIQREVIHKLLEKISKAEMLKFLEGELKNFDTLPLTEIGTPSAIGQPLKAYKGNAIQKTSAEYSNNFLNTQFDVGSKPKRIAIKGVPPRTEQSEILVGLAKDKVYKIKNLPLSEITKLEMGKIDIKNKLKSYHPNGTFVLDLDASNQNISITYLQGYSDTHSIAIDYGITPPPGFLIDYLKMLDATVKKKIEKLIAIIGITWEEINLKPELKIVPKVPKKRKEKVDKKGKRKIKDEKQKTLSQFKC